MAFCEHILKKNSWKICFRMVICSWSSYWGFMVVAVGPVLQAEFSVGSSVETCCTTQVSYPLIMAEVLDKFCMRYEH